MADSVQTTEIEQPTVEDDCEAVAPCPPSPSKRKSTVPQRAKKAPRGTKTLVSKNNKSVIVDGEKKKKRRFKPGTVALREIRALQSTTNFLVPEAPMYRLIKQITQEQKSGARMTKNARQALQTAVESFLTDMFADSMKLAVYAGRRQLSVNDIRYTIEQYGMQMSKEYLDGLRRRLGK